MRALVGIETALLALLSVLVAGLLRSHAELLRALHRLGAGIDDTRDTRDTSGGAHVRLAG